MQRVRSLRDLLSATGLDVRTVRGRSHWRAGVEFIWHAFDRKTERAVISHVDSFGEEVLFLVRDQRDYIQSHFLEGDFYAEDELKLIQQHYRGGAFLDVGANVGNHSLFAAKILRCDHVIAIEPNPDAYKILRCNIALNGLEQVIHHQAIALSDHSGSGSIHASAGNLGQGILTENGGDTPLVRGDDLFADRTIGFLKVDVEGHELAVLRGLEQTIRRDRPSAMIEVDDDKLDEFQDFVGGLDYTTVASFKPYRDNSYALIVPRETV